MHLYIRMALAACALGALLLSPREARAQWYGWGEQCREYVLTNPDGPRTPYSVCTDVMVSLTNSAADRYTLTVQSTWNSTLGEAFWGFGSIAYFYTPELLDCSSRCTFIPNNGYGAWWGRPDEWTTRTFEGTGDLALSDLLGYYGEFYVRETYSGGYSVLTQRPYSAGGTLVAVPEPTHVPLVATVMATLSGFMRRRSVRRMKGRLAAQ